ncbi:Carbohydrate kinase, FGGY family, partial [uncultured Rubrobacteraceae bacterium]
PLGRLHGRHDPRPVHRGGGPGLDGLHRGLVQEPVRGRRGGGGQGARCGYLRRPDRAGTRGAHRFRRADSTRLLPGQSLALHRPPGARHDVGPDPEPHPRARVPRHHRGHLLRHGEHSAHHARAGLRAEAQRRLRWSRQERPVDADARRRLERPDLVYAGERRPRSRLGDAGRRRGWLLPEHSCRRPRHGPYRGHHRARPRPPRGIQVLRGPLPGGVSPDEGIDAQDRAPRRRRSTGGSM